MPRNDLKAYTSLIARIPQDLADQVKRYAREHRCTVSELIRDGLEMRLDTDLPWHAPGDSRSTDGEVLPEVLHTMEALKPMLRALVQDTVRTTMTEVLQEVSHRETNLHTGESEVLPEVLPYGDQVLHGHTSALQAAAALPNGGMTEVIQGHTEVLPQQPAVSTVHGGMTEVVPSPVPPAQPSPQGITEVLPFDTAKYVLGKLCPRGHAWGSTGQSLLRRTNRHCGTCDREKFHERKQAKRQATAP
jgi:hypothetical protein